MMITKRECLFVSFILFFLMNLSYVQASSAGVSPAIHEINFQPGFEGDFQFNYFFDTDIELNISVRGDFAQYATVDRAKLPGNGGTVGVHVKLPQTVSPPGTHRIEVIASPDLASLQREGGIAIVPAIGGVIKVYVPYPGKYAEIEFEIRDSNEGEQTPYILTIHSRGEEPIMTNSSIEIFDSNNLSKKVFDIGQDILEGVDSKSLGLNLDTSELGAGNYFARATTAYSGGEAQAEDIFRIGELFINITNFTQVVKKNTINPFFIDIVSKWNDPINGVYADFSVEGLELSFSTPPKSLYGWEETRLEGYLDTRELEEEIDSIPARLIVHYGDKTTEKDVQIFLEDEEFTMNYTLIVIIVLAVLVIILFMWIFFKFKKLEKKNGKKK